MNVRFLFWGPIPVILTVGAMMTMFGASPTSGDGTSQVAMVIHGGAGTIRPENLTPEVERAYHDALTKALRVGWEILSVGGTSVDAVEASIRLMEDSPLFNAGKGAVFTADGHNELDASIMDGRDLQAGAVSAVRGVRNPVTLARAVMEHSPHVLLMGRGAEAFAHEHGIQFEDSAYFWTERRWQQLQRARQKEAAGEDQGLGPAEEDDYKFGTVGAVALDANGNIATATSTGGTTNKHWGRVGDSPIIGAGTWADNRTCGVSCTGTGEYFIRGVIAYRVASLIEAGHSLKDAARLTVQEDLIRIGGPNSGGLIALDKDGNIAMPFNTVGMYRGYIRADGEAHTFLFADTAAPPAKEQ